MNSNPIIVFNFNNELITMQCSQNEKMEDICRRYAQKLQEDYKSLYFIYSGNIVNPKLSFAELISKIDKIRNEMQILVYINYLNDEEGIKCPKCGEIIKQDKTQIDNVVSSINEEKNQLDGVISIIKNINMNSGFESVKNQLNIVVKELNSIKSNLGKYNEKLKSFSNDNNKNFIKGLLEIKFNEINNKIPLFNTEINEGIEVYINNKKINMIRNNNKGIIDFNFRNSGFFPFEIVLPNNITSLNSFFDECSNIISLDLSNFNSSNVTDMYRMFNKCTRLQYIEGLNKLNTNKVKNMSGMFQNCYEIEFLDLTNFNTSNVINMAGMFKSCNKLKEIKGINNFNTYNVTDMKIMFGDCYELEYLDLSNFRTKNVTDMKKMFNKCTKLKEVKLNNFDTSNVTNMMFMFSQCYKLTNIQGINKFNTANVTEMNSMFNECSDLEYLDLSNFNTSKVNNMIFMFYKCNKLRVLNLLNFDISNCNDEGRKEMFSLNKGMNFQFITNNKMLESFILNSYNKNYI